MLRQTLVVAALALGMSGALAQQAASAPVSAAKKELVAKVLQLQQRGYEAFVEQIALGPAQQMGQQLNVIFQRVPADKREALGRELQADLAKYAEEVRPIAREAARKAMPSTVGALLEERMTEQELRQVISVLENPAHRKFLSLGGDMQRSLGEKAGAEMRAALQPKVQALEQSIRRRLEAAAPQGAASAPR